MPASNTTASGVCPHLADEIGIKARSAAGRSPARGGSEKKRDKKRRDRKPKRGELC